MTRTISIIGAGKLGKTIGRLLIDYSNLSIASIYCRSIHSAKVASDFLQQGSPTDSLSQIKPADIFLIATPDDYIESTCNTLAKLDIFSTSNIVFHCAGALTATQTLYAAKEKGCKIASVHPMHSFSDPNTSLGTFTGAFCAIEGDDIARNSLAILFEKIGGHTFTLQSKQKTTYHAAGVMASNYLITLAHESVEMLKSSGLDETTSLELVIHLMQGSLTNLKKLKSTQKALTGPIQRGDGITINNHLTALTNPELHQLYQQLGKATLKLANIDLTIKKQLADMLTEDTP